MKHKGSQEPRWKAGNLPNIASLFAENERLRVLLAEVVSGRHGTLDVPLLAEIRAALAVKP